MAAPAPDRSREVRRVLWLVLWLNLAVSAVKLSVGLATGALAIVADAFHSLVDSSSNIIGLVGLWIAARPADANHPYGHRKYETVATLGIGGLLLVAGFEIGRSVVERFLAGQAAAPVEPIMLAVMGGTFVVNLGVTLYETRAGRRLNSPLLLADSAHTRTDLYVTLSVIGALIGARLGLPWLDGVVAGAVVLLLFRAAFSILRSSSDVLTDVATADPAQVAQIVSAVPGVEAVDGVRSRGSSGAAYVDLNIRVNPAMDTEQAHAVASEVEQRIAEAIPDVVDTVVHIEPEWDNAQTGWAALAIKLRQVADGQSLGLHDLHAHVEHDGSLAVEAHLEMADDLTLGEAHAVADLFEKRAHEALPELRSLVTHLEPISTYLPDEGSRLSSANRKALRDHLTDLADGIAGTGACHSVVIHHIAGHVTATLHITQPAEVPLIQAHALAERIEQALHSSEPLLSRVVVHVEPPE
ncbi:MAG: cation diffusion facilitator family transporter [Anaerolineales bacterium]|nr:cation diffusion facilitator family transporter [Anaerolineales bacterium]